MNCLLVGAAKFSFGEFSSFILKIKSKSGFVPAGRRTALRLKKEMAYLEFK